MSTDEAEAALIAEIGRSTEAALADPAVRLGTVHKVEEVPEGPGGHPYIAITFSWAEPADDPAEPPTIRAMTLFIHPALLDAIHREFAGVHPCAQITDHPADGNSP